MAKKKLTIQFDDNSKVEYVIPANVDWRPYWERDSLCSDIKLAWVREYPFKNHEPIMLKGSVEDLKKK